MKETKLLLELSIKEWDDLQTCLYILLEDERMKNATYFNKTIKDILLRNVTIKQDKGDNIC